MTAEYQSMTDFWKSASNWPTEFSACSKNQSPIDLSESDAGKCEALCEWSLNDSFPTSVTLHSSEYEPVLEVWNTDGNVTSVWNGQTCKIMSAIVFHPAQHTIDGTRYDGEFVMSFYTPGGKKINVSVLLQIQSKESASTKFFHAFAPYANQTDGSVIKCPEGWSFSHALPNDPGYFVYQGTDILPHCDPVTWVVFKRPVGILAADIASINTVVPAGYRPVAPLGSRKLFWNDGTNTKMSLETLQANDDRVYIRCQPLENDVSVQQARDASTAKIQSLEGTLQAKAQQLSPAISDQLASLGPAGMAKLVGIAVAWLFTAGMGFQGGKSIAQIMNLSVATIRVYD